jgi:hypothetical protein
MRLILFISFITYLTACSKMQDYESPKGSADRRFAVNAAYVNVNELAINTLPASKHSTNHVYVIG